MKQLLSNLVFLAIFLGVVVGFVLIDEERSNMVSEFFWQGDAAERQVSQTSKPITGGSATSQMTTKDDERVERILSILVELNEGEGRANTTLEQYKEQQKLASSLSDMQRSFTEMRTTLETFIHTINEERSDEDVAKILTAIAGLKELFSVQQVASVTGGDGEAAARIVGMLQTSSVSQKEFDKVLAELQEVRKDVAQNQSLIKSNYKRIVDLFTNLSKLVVKTGGKIIHDILDGLSEDSLDEERARKFPDA